MRLEADGRPLKGEFLRSANVVNEMITQMGVFTSEVTRVAREVGTEGKLAARPAVLGSSGVERSHRQRFDGGEPDRPGAQHPAIRN